VYVVKRRFYNLKKRTKRKKELFCGRHRHFDVNKLL
jgi:hypothetical protein